MQVGQSLFDKAGSEKVAQLVEKAKKNNVELVFPVDYITADKFDKDANVRIYLSYTTIISVTEALTGLFVSADRNGNRRRGHSRGLARPRRW